VIKAENELESLRKEFIGTTINYLERFKEEGHKKDPKGRENPLKLLSQLTIGTLKDLPSEFIRKLTNGKELNNWEIQEAPIVFIKQ